MSSYLQALRSLIGHRSVIHPAARIIIENKAGEVLLIRRTDNNRWGLPAGGLEEGEDIIACIRREVLEETRLDLGAVELIGISSQPDRESVQYPNGDRIQYFVVEFYCNQWTGSCNPDQREVHAVQFFPRSTLPDLPAQEAATFESLRFFQSTGKVLLR